jgi:AcrR family transcriptional regulator
VPKHVDPDDRRAHVGEAVWRLVRSQGLAGVSVRNVAKEAELSTGSLRHYFASQSDLLAFAMQLVIDRVRDRVQSVIGERGPDPVALARLVLNELLPLDDDRRAEAEVWFAFTAFAQTERRLRAVRDESYALLEELCRQLVEVLVGGAPGVDERTEAERLYALLDGLVLHCIVRPDRATPELMHDVIERHLAQLVQSGSTTGSGSISGAEPDR